MVFVDTGPWFASVVPSDPRHGAVRDWHRQNALPLLTSDSVIDEVLTLLRSRGKRERAISLGRHFFDLSGVPIHFAEPDDLRRAWGIFRQFPHRYWSFTDCVSKVVIERFHIKSPYPLTAISRNLAICKSSRTVA